MQIHELNTFAGTPGDNNFLAIDNGSDTGKISGTSLLAPVNGRIDNLAASVTPDSVVTLKTDPSGMVGTVTLSESVANFNFLDLYFKDNNGKHVGGIRVPVSHFPAEISLASEDGSDNFMYINRVSLSVSGTSMTVNYRLWEWSGDTGDSATVSSGVWTCGLTRVDGIKTSSNTPAELADIRVGYDGVTYPSAGDAVRANDGILNQKTLNLNEDMYIDTGMQRITLLSGYVNTNVNPVTYAATASSEWLYSIVDCSEGDVFIINGEGEYTPRLWFFGDASGNRILHAAANSVVTNDLFLIAPSGAKKLVINVKTTSLKKNCYIGIPILNRVKNAERFIENKVGFITNLFDKSSATIGKYINDVDGSLADSGSYNTTDFIPVHNGNYIVTPSTRKILLYDDNKNSIPQTYRGSEESSPVITVTDGMAYVRFSYAAANHNDTMMIPGNEALAYYLAYGVKKFEEDIHLSDSMSDEIMNITNITKSSKQLVDVEAYTHGAIDSDDTVRTNSLWDGYETTDYIKIRSGKTYSIYFANSSGNIGVPRRVLYLLLDENKTPVTHNNIAEPTNGLVQITASYDGYLRISCQTAYFFPQLICIEGTTLIPYQAYYKYLDEGYGLNNKQKSEVSEIISENNDAMSFDLSGNNLTLESTFGSGKIKHTFATVDPSGRNGLPNFVKTEIYNSSGVIVGTKPEDDDIAPIRIKYFETVGANHGYPFVYKIAKADQTDDDIGSVWTDGTNNFLLVSTDDTYCYMLAPTGIYSGTVRVNTDRPDADLTPVSGAVHQTTIPISGLENGRTYLYPSVNNIKTTVYADGKIINGDYSGEADEVVIDSEYGVLSYVGIWNYLPNHTGSFDADSIDAVVSIKMRVSFKPHGKCTVTTTMIIHDDITLADCGFLQAQAIKTTGNDQLWRYINGLNSISGYDFSSFINISSYNSDLMAMKTDLKNNNVPPDRLVDWLIVNNEKVFGFTLGYVSDIADSENATRLSNCVSGNLWDIRHTKKIYPVAISQLEVHSGDVFTVAGYRNYLEPCELVNENPFEYAGVGYAAIDDSTSGFKTSGLDGKFVGREIFVIDATNANVKNEIVSTGIITELSGAGGCFVKLK